VTSYMSTVLCRSAVAKWKITHLSNRLAGPQELPSGIPIVYIAKKKQKIRTSWQLSSPICSVWGLGWHWPSRAGRRPVPRAEPTQAELLMRW